jgi:hypothetical protein
VVSRDQLPDQDILNDAQPCHPVRHGRRPAAGLEFVGLARPRSARADGHLLRRAHARRRPVLRRHSAGLIKWLYAHNNRHDAFDLPAVLAGTIKADGKTRLGTAGLFTH